LACGSLTGAFVVLSSTGCLITSTPDFGSPQQTPPLLVAADALPALTQPTLIVPANATMDPSFSAAVLSEDAGDSVSLELLIDYGDQNGDNPYQHSPQNSEQIDPGSLTDGPRATGDLTLDRTLLSLSPDGKAACHTVTMMASHKFAPHGSGCPVCITDSSTLTWLVVACPASDGPTCGTFELDVDHCGLLTQHWTAGCPMDLADGGTCPFQPSGSSSSSGTGM
jgi:hypothetical protein